MKETQAIQNKCTKIKSLENGKFEASNCRGMMESRQKCFKVCFLLSWRSENGYLPKILLKKGVFFKVSLNANISITNGDIEKS